MRWIIGFVMAVCIAGFAVFNRAVVSVVWSPIHDPVTMPLYLTALGALVVGFLFGGVTVWLNMASVRREKRQQKKELKVMEKEIDKLKKNSHGAEPPVSELFPALPYKSN